MNSFGHWLSNISPDTVILILGTIAGFFGWSSSKGTKVDWAHSISDSIRTKFDELVIDPSTLTTAKAELEKVAWYGLEKLGVKPDNKVVALAVHVAVDEAFDRLVSTIMTAQLNNLAVKVESVKDAFNAPPIVR